jgi:hypothetical protein
MRTTVNLLFLILFLTLAMVWAVLPPVTSYAASSQQTSGASPVNENSTKKNSTKQSSANQNSASPTTDLSRDDRSDKSSGSANAGAAKTAATEGGLIKSETVNNTLPARPASAARRTVASHNGLRKNSQMHATPQMPAIPSTHAMPQMHVTPWKSGASAPRKAPEMNAGFSPGGHTSPPERVAPQPVSRSLNPPPSNTRHRGSNPAVVGGSANSASSNTAALNGTRMNRRP